MNRVLLDGSGGGIAYIASTTGGGGSGGSGSGASGSERVGANATIPSVHSSTDSSKLLKRHLTEAAAYAILDATKLFQDAARSAGVAEVRAASGGLAQKDSAIQGSLEVRPSKHYPTKKIPAGARLRRTLFPAGVCVPLRRVCTPSRDPRTSPRTRIHIRCLTRHPHCLLMEYRYTLAAFTSLA